MRSCLINSGPLRYIQLGDEKEFWRLDLTVKRDSWENISAWMRLETYGSLGRGRLFIAGDFFVRRIFFNGSRCYIHRILTSLDNYISHSVYRCYPQRIFGDLVMYERVEETQMPYRL
jgi:hypothetical protein